MSCGRRVDVCVVGAGPAGSTLAIRLAELGMDVAIVDRAKFPRPHIGESIAPGAWPLLALLGVADEIAWLACHHSAEAAVRWRTDQVERRRTPGNATVDRGRFDAILLDRARAAGVQVFEGARIHERETAAHGWTVALPDCPLHATILGDATGRRRLLGGRRTPTAPRTLAVHAVLADNDRDSTDTRIEAVEHGWIWGARMRDGRLRVILFVDPAALETAGRRPAVLLREALSTTTLFARAGIGAPDVLVHACDATSYTSGPVIGSHHVAVGEAAFAIDPLSSSGVQTAIQTAMSAAVAVATIVDTAGDTAAALEFYELQVSHAVQRHTATASAVYAKHQRFAGSAFWRSRRDETPVPAEPELLALLGRRVRLHEQATVRAVACAIGDRVRRVPALDHADLVRPVAYLDGVALAPLLNDLWRAESLGAALERWQPAVPHETALRIAAWLCAHRIIVATEPAPGTAPL